MRFTCSSTDFLEALSVATHALPTRTTIPALECVLLETREDGLRMTCSDASLTIITRCDATIEEGGAVLLPGKLLSEVSRRMAAGILEVHQNDGHFMVFTCEGSRTQIAVRAANTYPSVGGDESPAGGDTVVIGQKALKSMILETSFAIATDDERPILTGCLLDAQGEEASMVALDGFRMAIRTQPLATPAHVRAVIPGKALQEIARILSDDAEETLSIHLSGGRMVTRIGDTEIYAVLKEGEFIHYEQITPKSHTTSVRINAAALQSRVERAALIAREGKNNIVKLEIGLDSLTITSTAETSNQHEQLPVEMEGEPLLIGFNVKYLSDALKALGDVQIDMQFQSPVSPCVIVPAEEQEGEGRFLHLILPLRLRA